MHKSINKDVRELAYSEAIREGVDQAMKDNPSLVVIGEGVPDPKSIFLTTRISHNAALR